MNTFNNVVYDSTTLGVDPTKDESEYEAKPGVDKKISPEAKDEARKKLLADAAVPGNTSVSASDVEAALTKALKSGG